MDTLTVGIIIIIGCVIFKIISWILICRNTRDEKKRLKRRQNLRPSRCDRQAIAILAAGDIEKQATITTTDSDSEHQEKTRADDTTGSKEPTTLMTVAEAPTTTTTNPSSSSAAGYPDQKTEESPDSKPLGAKDAAALRPQDGGGGAEPTAEAGSAPGSSGPEASGTVGSVVVPAAVAVAAVAAGGAVVGSVVAASGGDDAADREEKSRKVEDKENKDLAPEEPEANLPSAKTPDLRTSVPKPSANSPHPDLRPTSDPQPPPLLLDEPDSSAARVGKPPSRDLDTLTRSDSDLEPPPPIIVPSVGGAGITLEGIKGAEPPIPDAEAGPGPVPPEQKKKKKKKKLTALRKPSGGVPAGDDGGAQKAQPVSDFDDYHSIHLKHLPPVQDSSSPPPALYNSPPQHPRPPPRTSRQVVNDRRKMERKLRDQEGMDF